MAGLIESATIRYCSEAVQNPLLNRTIVHHPRPLQAVEGETALAMVASPSFSVYYGEPDQSRVFCLDATSYAGAGVRTGQLSSMSAS